MGLYFDGTETKTSNCTLLVDIGHVISLDAVPRDIEEQLDLSNLRFANS